MLVRLLIAFMAALLAAACSSGGDGGTDGGVDAADGSGGDSGMDGDDGSDLPDPVCFETGPGPYEITFTDVTVELGLGPGGLAVTGSQVMVADVDSDNWPDLVLTRGQAVREDPQDPAGRYWLLRNASGAGFEDRTWSSNLFLARDGTQGRATSFVLFADLDNDGDQDAFSVVYEDWNNTADILDHTAVFLNDGLGGFSIGPQQDFTSGSFDPLLGATFLDYDRDGLVDVFTGHYYGRYPYPASAIQDSLFRGDGAGGFTDVTDAAGLATLPFSYDTAAQCTNHKPTWGVTACDVDGDGWTDLMATSYGRQFNAFYRNTGGAFEDLTLSSGFGSDPIEDYSDNQFFLCFCQYHPDEPDCAGASAPMIDCIGPPDLRNSWSVGVDDQPWRLGGNSSGTLCGDIDNDGDMDLLALELAHWHIGRSSDKTELLINDRFPQNPLFRPGNEEMRLTREHVRSWNEGDLGGALADFDNDGRLDVLVASSDYPDTYSLLWQQSAAGKFNEVGEQAGARIHRAHGLGVIDFDRDGDYDLVVGTSLMRWGADDDPPPPEDAYAYLLRNDTGQSANKMMFHLIGAGGPGGANRDAIGARITLRAGSLGTIREVQGGHGLSGFQHDKLIIVGIGESCSASTVRIRWPNADGTEDTHRDVLANYVVIIEEGKGLRYMTLEEFTGR